MCAGCKRPGSIAPSSALHWPRTMKRTAGFVFHRPTARDSFEALSTSGPERNFMQHSCGLNSQRLLWQVCEMRILVVEDEEKVSRFVTRGLAAERFAVDVARDGKTGWELAQTYQYDLIILDLMLPGLTGGEVLRRIRKANSQVPVLILTARDSLGDKIEHFEAGADDYLTKPFAFAELLVRVKPLLG